MRIPQPLRLNPTQWEFLSPALSLGAIVLACVSAAACQAQVENPNAVTTASFAGFPTVNLTEEPRLEYSHHTPTGQSNPTQGEPSLDLATSQWVDTQFATPQLNAPTTTTAQFLELPFQSGYDGGFVITSDESALPNSQRNYLLKVNGFGQLRHSAFDAKTTDNDLNQLQMKRARIILSGHAFTPDFRYFVQLDGRSNAGDTLRILDYYLTYDLGHHSWNMPEGVLGIKTGLYKMPFSNARYLSGKQFQFADRSMASMYFDVNRSLAAGLYGRIDTPRPLFWEAAMFNGLVTGGAETGSSGTLDNNNAFAARVFSYPTGQWGQSELADLEQTSNLATRIGAGAAFTTIDRRGTTEFNALRVVDSGAVLANLLPLDVDSYDVALFSIDGSLKWQGWSLTSEYYFRTVSGFDGGGVSSLFDHGLWLQSGYFIIPGKFELLARMSRVQGNSGTLGGTLQSAEEIAGGVVNYFREQHAKLTIDITYHNGSPINSPTLDIAAGEVGWLYRTQLQFSF